MTLKERKEVRRQIAEYISNHRELAYRQMSEILGIPIPTLQRAALEFGIHRHPCERMGNDKAKMGQLLDFLAKDKAKMQGVGK